MATIDTGPIQAVETISVGSLTDTGPLQAVEVISVAGAPVVPVTDTGPVTAIEAPTGILAPASNLPPPTPLGPWPLISDLVPVLSLADPRAAANPNVYSISYRCGWNKIQQVGPASGQPTNDPNDASFAWAFTDSCFAQAESFGKYVWLRYLVQQGSCPGWCRQNVLGYFDTTGQRWNIWWDQVYISYLIAFVQAVAKRYGNRRSLAVFSANMHAGGTGDWSMPTVAPSTKANGAGNWTLAASFVCPAYGASVVVTPKANQKVFKGWVPFVPGFGWFLVTNVVGPNTNPSSVTLQNLGYAGNASSGTVPSSTIIRVSDIEQLTSPFFNYTTQKVVDAMAQVARAYVAAFPSNIVISQEVGRCPGLDPQPQAGVSGWNYNCATRVAQAVYNSVPKGRWAISKDTVHAQWPLPRDAIAAEDASQSYLTAQPPYGSVNTSGSTGVIPAGSLGHMQFNWNCVDPSGQYTPDSTASQAGGPYAANGGVYYNRPTPVFAQTLQIARYYQLKRVECYEIDILGGCLDATAPAENLVVPPYAGQNQPPTINAQPPPPGWEDGPRCSAYLPGGQTETGLAPVPPPVKMTDIFAAQQVWPL